MCLCEELTGCCFQASWSSCPYAQGPDSKVRPALTPDTQSADLSQVATAQLLARGAGGMW